ncbi:sensor histidine kinase [Niallia circulans]|uniref:histidine kinase n=1 Tax=Niallia circulans TaxID=1397 RepID=A0A941GJT3_NIACI|nr:HAMP domain-containing sensor histidine kinase [Niallia circulans]MCB5237416.1 HAMP domain-containing histidine kinase [Niallia circulans]
MLAFPNIEQLSYHLLVIILPIVWYLLVSKEDVSQRKKLISNFSLILFIMLFFTMVHPIQMEEGLFYDLKVVPILLAFVYGGLSTSILLTVILIGYKFFLLGNGFYINILNYSIAGAIILFLKNKLVTLTFGAKWKLIMGVYWLCALTRVIFVFITEQVAQLPFVLIYSFTTWGALFIVTSIIQYNDEKILNQKKVQIAERLNAVSQLAASVAHEVRNPMTSVKGFLQLISGDNNLSGKQRKYIEISLQELERTETIISDYLSMAKPVSKEEEENLNITTELRGVIEVMTSYTNTHNIIIDAVIPNQLYCKGKKNEFKQAMINMMKNSVEAMNGNGVLKVRAYALGEKVFIEIEDNGIGMTSKQVKQLGTPYYSTKDKGTGIGLTLVYRIIRDMKGEISVVSKKGQGTTFRIALLKTIV